MMNRYIVIVALLCLGFEASAQGRSINQDFVKTKLREAFPPEAKCVVDEKGPECKLKVDDAELWIHQFFGQELNVQMTWPGRPNGLPEQLRSTWRKFILAIGFSEEQVQKCAQESLAILRERLKNPRLSPDMDFPWHIDKAFTVKNKNWIAHCSLRGAKLMVFDIKISLNNEF